MRGSHSMRDICLSQGNGGILSGGGGLFSTEPPSDQYYFSFFCQETLQLWGKERRNMPGPAQDRRHPAWRHGFPR